MKLEELERGKIYYLVNKTDDEDENRIFSIIRGYVIGPMLGSSIICIDNGRMYNIFEGVIFETKKEALSNVISSIDAYIAHADDQVSKFKKKSKYYQKHMVVFATLAEELENG